jgi:glutamate-1-semialdehyde 2,1-aminomutase
MNKGFKLWKKSIKIIPGGNGLLSKRPERYASHLWPTYFERSKGISLIDLSGKKWKDFAQMGVGAAILGYNNKEVNDYVCSFINKGINTTLNCPEEYLLAKKLIKINSFASLVRFSRSGGEAMSMAVRIARAKTNSYKVAFSGYHGWHDWYLATNLNSKNGLDDQLLPGLKTSGVPKKLINTAFPFKYNSVTDLKKIITSNPDLKIIIVEGARSEIISNEMSKYLEYLKLKKNFIIIIDEITSGLRTSLSGAYKLAKLTPNIVVYGKALGNGFAINAILGDNTLDVSQDTFMSSSFHTERVGFVAAIKTIEIIEREKLWKYFNKIGNRIIKSYKSIANSHNIKLITNNFNPLPSFQFQYGFLNNVYNTYVIQELLKKNYLAANSVYLSMSHSEREVDKYLYNLDIVFKKLSKIIKNKEIKENFLEIPIIDQGFKRLT